jgi:hypothetical protein
MVEEECYYVENVSGINENTPSTSFPHMLLVAPIHISTYTLVHVPFSFISNVENVHLQAFNILNVDASQLAII